LSQFPLLCFPLFLASVFIKSFFPYNKSFFIGLPNLGNCYDLQCFISGECTFSQGLDILSSKDEFQCLDNCHQNANCTWFSFFPDSLGCHLMSNCQSIVDDFCPNCISGQRECDNPAPICFVNGLLLFFQCCLVLQQRKPLNVITLEQRETDNINQMMTITDLS
jgi:hypothetical protein